MTLRSRPITPASEPASQAQSDCLHPTPASRSRLFRKGAPFSSTTTLLLCILLFHLLLTTLPFLVFKMAAALKRTSLKIGMIPADGVGKEVLPVSIIQSTRRVRVDRLPRSRAASCPSRLFRGFLLRPSYSSSADLRRRSAARSSQVYPACSSEDDMRYQLSDTRDLPGDDVFVVLLAGFDFLHLNSTLTWTPLAYRE